MKITEWLNTEMLRVIEWSIIHSFWQFLILFAALKVLLMLIGKNSSRLRYFIGLVFLTGSVLCSVLTFNHEYQLYFGNGAAVTAGAAAPAKTAALVKANAAALTNTPAPGAILLNFLDTISPYLTFGWIAGMLLYLVIIANSGFYLRALRKLPGEVYPGVSKKLAELANRMQIGKTVQLIINNSVFEPLTFGNLKPVILLPCSYVARVPMEQLEMILAHELAHIKRYDYLVNLVQTGLEAIYFYNPFFRAMSNAVRNEREFCCDDIAATVCGNKKALAVALANLKMITSQPGLSLAAAPKKSAFFERISRLTEPAPGSKPLLKNAAFSFVLITFTLLFLTKCVYDHNENDTLPTVKDPVTQLLTDNQANYKEQLFSYEKAGALHDILLVSTVNGKPLYAYLDGNPASNDQFTRIAAVIRQKRNMTANSYFKIINMKQGGPSGNEIAAMKKDRGATGANSHWKIYTETDSLNKLIKQTKAALAAHSSTDLEKKLKDLDQQVKIRNKEEVYLSMAEYRAQIKLIPVDVKLHVLLTKIITNKEYTAEDRNELVDLAKKRQGS